MGELGYLENPDYELGMLRAQAMRAVRVVVDIGMHLELAIPAHERYHPGEQWTPELALPFVIERSRFPEDFMRSEVDRYLGLPGQAISYKVGERVWLESRADARRRHGASFDLKAWHEFALSLGCMGLDQFSARELAALLSRHPDARGGWDRAGGWSRCRRGGGTSRRPRGCRRRRGWWCR